MEFPSTTDGSTRSLVIRVWREWVRPHRARLALAFALMAVVAAATGAYPLLIERSYAMFEAPSDAMMILVPAAIIAITCVKALALYAQVVVTNGIVQRIVTDGRGALFDHLTGADLAQIDAEPIGSLTARFITDAERVRTTLVRTVTGLVRDLLTVVALVGAMVWLNWSLALVMLVVYPIAGWPIARIGKRLRRLARATQAQTGRMTAVVGESLSGARMIKAYGLETVEEGRAGAAFEENYRLTMATTRRRSLLDPLLEALGGLAVAGVIALAGWQITTGRGTVGEFSGFIGALLIAAQPMRSIGTLNSVLQEGLAAVARMFELIDRAPTIVDAADARPLPPGPGVIRFDGVTLRYPGADHDALAGFTATIAAGTSVALVGPSGAGKSTVFNLIPRFIDPSAGMIAIDGHTVAGVTLESLRRSIAVVSQEAVLFDDTVRANIAFGRPGADDTAIEAAARAAAAHDFIMALPGGYDTPVGERGSSLSGGQRQRIALARAFLKDAPILLLDEATSALDAESERLVNEALDRLSEGRTTLVIAHRLSTVRRVDRILVMDGGRIVEDGDHDTLVAADGVYARLHAAGLAS